MVLQGYLHHLHVRHALPVYLKRLKLLGLYYSSSLTPQGLYDVICHELIAYNSQFEVILVVSEPGIVIEGEFGSGVGLVAVASDEVFGFVEVVLSFDHVGVRGLHLLITGLEFVLDWILSFIPVFVSNFGPILFGFLDRFVKSLVLLCLKKCWNITPQFLDFFAPCYAAAKSLTVNHNIINLFLELLSLISVNSYPEH